MSRTSLFLLALAAQGCGGAVAPSVGAEPVADAGASAPSSTGSAGKVTPSPSPTSCAAGDSCVGGGTCRPCKDDCDVACDALFCVSGTWRARRGTPPRPAHCDLPEPVDAGPGPIPACTLPPVDVTHCNVDADCTKVMKGCFCGPQPVLGVNNAYASAVQTCEAAEAANCNIRCAQENTYRPSHGAGTVLDPDLIVARCDTTGLVGACVTEIP